MELTLNELIATVRSATDDPLDQVRRAVDTAAVLAKLGDSLVNHFVEVARRGGHGWAELAPCLSDRDSPPSTPGSATARIEAEPLRAAIPDPVHEHHGKYRSLWQWLVRQEGSEITTTFSEIEDILGFELPPSSREHQPHWYGYKGSAVARAIIDAGWRARNVNLVNESLTLTRGA